MTTKKEPQPDVLEIEADEVELTQQEQSEKLIKRHMYWAMGLGLIPVPLLDLASISAAQIRLVSKMSEVYEVPFSEHRAKNIIMPLIASVGVAPIATGVLGSFIKFVPVVGSLAGTISLPIVAAATTYAIGRVFIMHFETGGTISNLDPQSVKEYYRQMFTEGTKVAAGMKKDADTEKNIA